MGKETDFHLVNAREFRAYGVPFGSLIFSLSRLSHDEGTQLGMKNALEIIGDEGLVLLDYHKSMLDIVVTSAIATDNIPIKSFTGPVAARYFDIMVLRHLLKKINKVTGVEAIPVIRHKERKEGYLEKHEMTRAQADEINEAYNRRIDDATALPYHVAMIAPFGTREKDKRDEIKDGVAKLLQKGRAAICTYTAVTKHPKPFEVLLDSRFLRFNQDSSLDEMSEIIAQRFEVLKSTA